jgi:hypothetical protein
MWPSHMTERGRRHGRRGARELRAVLADGSTSVRPVRRIDLGPCAGLLHESDLDRCVVVLPGMQYSTQAPLLWFAREVAAARGWSVLEVLDSPPDGAEPFGWARDRARRALDHVEDAGELVVVGKSLASAAAGIVADRVVPAVWLTPLLNEARVVDDLSRAARPALLIGGTADAAWVPDALADSGLLHVVQLDGLDHSLQRPGDPAASLGALRAIAERIDRFFDDFV